VMRTVMTSSYKDRQKPAAPFTSMPKKDFGRCDGHHEMDDFHARKKRSAPGLGAAFSFKRKSRACRGRSADCRLLRPRRQRPRRRAADERDELAALHSITSSASASNLSGISRPRAFAATTLITSSYLVGNSIGKSPGFVPLRMGATYCEPARRYASVSLAP